MTNRSRIEADFVAGESRDLIANLEKLGAALSAFAATGRNEMVSALEEFASTVDSVEARWLGSKSLAERRYYGRMLHDGWCSLDAMVWMEDHGNRPRHTPPPPLPITKESTGRIGSRRV